MEPVREPEKPVKKVEIKDDQALTAPEVIDMPVPKEPLKIKILHDDSEFEPEAEQPPRKMAKSKKPSKKSIAVLHDETEAAPEETETEVAAAIAADAMAEHPEEATDEPQTTSEDGPEEPVDEPASEESETTTEEPAEEETAQPESEPETPEAEPDEEPLPESPLIEDEQTEKAVEEIVAKEGDDLLAAEDKERTAAFVPPKKPTFGQKFKHAIGSWWRNPRARWLTLTGLFIAFVIAFIVPTSRYLMLNMASVRGSLSIQVLDNSTQQPLKNVKVSLGSVSGLTGADGRVRLSKVKLGPANLSIEKRAFAPANRKVTVGWGSNPLDEMSLTPTGAQYDFLVVDYLSGKSVEGVEASSGESSAISDKNGKIKLTLDQPSDEFEVTLNGEHLRQEKLKLNANTKATHPVKVVPSRKAVYISKRSGKFDIYKIDIDGKNEEKVLAGTGAERDDMTLLSHPSDEIVALISTRDNKRNKDGFLLSTLTIIDLSDNSINSVALSEQIRALDWIGNRLVYIQITEGASAGNPKRQRLLSNDYKTEDNKELATSNYFNDVTVIGTKVYFAPSSAYQANSGGLYKIDADGNNKQTIISQEIWNLFRTSYDHMALSADKQWFDYRLGDKAPTKLSGAPANLKSRVYVDTADGKKTLWTDNRDGKGVLLGYEPTTQTEKVLRIQSGLKNPVRWLNDNVVVYRISTEQETADYALSLNGGEPKKIRDVTATGGVDSWYYY